MRIPSVKTLSTITHDPKLLRKVLEAECADDLLTLLDKGLFPGADVKVRRSRYFRQMFILQMEMANELIPRGCGVEHIATGSLSRSPAIEYINTGDSYRATLMYIRGRFVVGDWGSIVERGDYY